MRCRFMCLAVNERNLLQFPRFVGPNTAPSRLICRVEPRVALRGRKVTVVYRNVDCETVRLEW